MSNEQPERPTSIDDLRPKMQLEGVVRRIELYGAFVDIGLERDGLVHISQLSDRQVHRVTDVVKEGDRVTVWVTDVDPEHGRVALTMVKPPEVEWKDIREGRVYTGKVVRIERYGVFVDFGAERPGLLHVREMGSRYIHHPSEVFQLGDEVEVRILHVDRRRKRIDLTMNDLLFEGVEEEHEEPLPTPMEWAFLKAQEEARRRQGEGAAKQGQDEDKPHRAELEEILSRTLRQLGD